MKSTNAEIEARVNKIYDLLVNGANRSQILQYCTEKAKWEVNERQIDEYIKRANQRLIELGKTHRETELGRAVARLNSLYFMSMSLQNFNVCLGIQRELNKLLGLNLEEDLLKRVEELEKAYATKN